MKGPVEGPAEMRAPIPFVMQTFAAKRSEAEVRRIRFPDNQIASQTELTCQQP